MKKSILNILLGVIGQLLVIALGIVVPQLLIKSLGSESNGLLSSISQLLVYLGLLEAGIGTATLQALYGPVARKDRHEINHILSATNIHYRKVGLIYLIIIVLTSIIYPLIIASEISYFDFSAVIFISGLSGVINYFFHGKYRILLQAEGKNYIISITSTIIQILTSASKIFLLNIGFGIVSLQISYFIINILQVLIYLWYKSKYYSWIDLSVQPNNCAIAQKNAVLIHQIATIIFNSTDMLILSIFEGFKVVSVYSMYAMLFNMINIINVTINSSVYFAMGQTYNNDRNRFINMHDSFETFNMALTFSLYCVAYIYILPFMKLYTAGVTDIQYIDNILPLLFVAVNLLSNGRVSSGQVIHYAGHFQKTQYGAIIEMLINIFVSIIGTYFMGIYGVLIGTIIALIYRANDMVLYANHKILLRSAKKTYMRWSINILLFMTIITISKYIPYKQDNYSNIFISAAITLLAVGAIFFAIASSTNRESYKYMLKIAKITRIRF